MKISAGFYTISCLLNGKSSLFQMLKNNMWKGRNFPVSKMVGKWNK